jgi:hypothetical protein
MHHRLNPFERPQSPPEQMWLPGFKKRERLVVRRGPSGWLDSVRLDV